MRLTQTIFSIVMLIAWMSATHHAVLEITGFMEHSSSAAESNLGQSGWHHAEKSVTKKASEPRQVLLFCFVLGALQLLFAYAMRREAHRLAATLCRWSEWVPSWNFTTRLALAPRAP